MARGAQPGERRGGRRRGTPNKTTGALKDAIIAAANDVGFDGHGQGGLTGYLKMVASSDVKAFAGLLGRVLPMQIAGHDGGPLKIIISPADAKL